MLSHPNEAVVAHSAMNSNKKVCNCDCKKDITLIAAVHSIFLKQFHAGVLIGGEQEQKQAKAYAGTENNSVFIYKISILTRLVWALICYYNFPDTEKGQYDSW